MRRGQHTVVLILLCLGVLAATPSRAPAEFGEFGIESFAASVSPPEAGAHGDVTTSLAISHRRDSSGLEVTYARIEDADVTLPPGLVGNPRALPTCSTGAFTAAGGCPTDSQVGIADIRLSGGQAGESRVEPLYNLEPPHPDEEVARFGFYAGIAPVFVDVSIRSAGDYGVSAKVHDAPGVSALLSVTTTFWGDPTSPVHDEQRLTTKEANSCPGTACLAPGGKRASGVEDPKAFVSNPSACQEQSAGLAITSYELPGQVFTASAPMQPTYGCEGLFFGPSLEMHPTNLRSGAPTGLKVKVRLPQRENPAERSAATMRDATVTLPEGMTISASAAQSLEACSAGQVGFHEEVPSACPDASKLGTVKLVSPALRQPLQGSIYQRTPSEGHQFGLWLVTDDLGLHVKLPGEVTGDPVTGQLTTRFSDLPQLPVEEIELDFWGGPRAPLKNPDECGSHQASFDFKPWSNDPDATGHASFQISEGCGQAFAPKLRGGVTHPVAGAFSPLLFTLTREDGEDNIKNLGLELPQGELAKLRGVALCPRTAIPSGDCPSDSKIGSIVIAAGAGPEPLWIPQAGKRETGVYLAGPYQGAPYSVVSVVPAQAGPFDLGTVSVQSGIFIDPESGKATIRSTLPQVLEGATILYRTIHVAVDRKNFALNPTDCRPMAIGAMVTGARGAIAHPDDRFQVGKCNRLPFGPKLSLRLRGGTGRSDYPALTATLRTRKHEANIDHVSVVLPPAEFLAQEHLRTICTRVRFTAGKCPRRSIYGYAEARTPLLSKPLKGPVYLRSSDHLLPDLVAALRGQIEIDLVGRIGSAKNGGMRTTFEQVPDAPVSSFVLHMNGGARGLLVNSVDVCHHLGRADVQMHGQNGRRMVFHPKLEVACRARVGN